MRKASLIFCSIIVVIGFALPLYASVIDSAEYKPEVFPDTITTPWYHVGSAPSQAYFSNHSLYIDSTQDPSGYYYSRTISADHSTDTITVEAKVKLVQYSGSYPGGCGIWWADNATSNAMTIYPNRIALYFPGYGNGPSFQMDTTGDYHVYKIVAAGPTNNVKVYIDGGSTPVIDTVISSGQGYDRNWVMFGDGSSSAGALAAWEYINYRVERSGVTISGVTVSIDIKPGETPNSINRASNGVVPVAVLGTPDFDATTIDPSTVTLANAPVVRKGKGDFKAAIEDVNGDGLPDMVFHFRTNALALLDTDTEAVLDGKTRNGTRITGKDSVVIVK